MGELTLPTELKRLFVELICGSGNINEIYIRTGSRP
jgi:hypothetical protein